jgi:hypothetical protein
MSADDVRVLMSVALSVVTLALVVWSMRNPPPDGPSG